MAEANDVIDDAITVVDDQKLEDLPSDNTPPGDPPADDDVVVTIGEAAPLEDDENRAPEWVRELRKANREKDKRIRELEQAAVKAAQPEPKGTVIGDKPTLAGCEYDEEEFEHKLLAWEGRKRQVEEEQRKKDDEAKKQQEVWNATLERHRKNATDLKVKDYDDAEEAARGALNEVQQAIIVSGAENSAVMLYALGKNEAKLKELATITDPVKFAFAVAKLEPQLKVTQRTKTPPLPEKTIKGSASLSGAVDSELDRLREEAGRTGDLSKVLAYQRNKKRVAA